MSLTGIRTLDRHQQTRRCMYFMALGAIVALNDDTWRDAMQFANLVCELLDRNHVSINDLPHGPKPFLENWLEGRPIDMTDEEYADAMNDRRSTANAHC